MAGRASYQQLERERELGRQGLGNQSSQLVSQTAAAQAPQQVALDPPGIYAGILRGQWSDYLQRFAPLEDMGNDVILDPERRRAVRSDFANAAASEVGSAFDRSISRMETLYSRSNQTRTGREQKAVDRTSALERTAATVSARNASRRYANDLDRDLLGI